MSALEKTAALERKDIPVGLLDKNTNNPNKMKAREFDLLVDNMQKTGITDPILVRRVGERYRIVGGHHRYDAATYLGFDSVPCTIIDDPEFDEEAETFQIVRMNVIRGGLDPSAFFKMYESLTEKYTDEVMQDLFGFAEEAEFKKLISHAAKSLPTPELQKKFKEAAAEVKTIDGLSKLLNRMFTLYGETLPYGYMVVDYGGQDSIWLRMGPKTKKALDIVGVMCIDKQRSVDSIIGGVVQLIANGELAATVDKLVASTPAVVLPTNMPVMPTEDNIVKVGSL